MRAASFKRLLDRRRSVLDKASLIYVISEGAVERMGILAMISARNLHSLAISLPSEHFRRRDQGATHTLPLMARDNCQGRQASQIPGCVEEWDKMHAYHAEDPGGGIVRNQHAIRGATDQRRQLLDHERGGCGVTQSGQADGDGGRVPGFCAANCELHVLTVTEWIRRSNGSRLSCGALKKMIH